MRLSTFILTNMEPILQEWEDFAHSLGVVTASMDTVALRDHAELILRAVAADLETPQTPAQQEAKSEGDAPPRPAHLPATAATSHGEIRAEEGFSLEEMVSEYRAVRASVLRLWTKFQTTPDTESFQQLMRFNEAIDEALAASIKTYSDTVEKMFEARARRRMEALGTLAAGLGHDMANVLMPMQMCLNSLTKEGPTPYAAQLVDDLRGAVGHLRGLSKGLRALSMDHDDCAASPEFTVLHEWWATAISPYKWALPRGVRLHVDGLGSSDPPLPPVRVPTHVLMQAVYNLVQNAAQALGRGNAAHPPSPSAKSAGNIWINAGLQAATPDAPVSAVRITVRDDGPGMDPSTSLRCTDAFFTTKPKHLGSGLGLYLVRTALERHGGQLVVESTADEGASFALILPAGAAEVPPVVTVRALDKSAQSR